MKNPTTPAVLNSLAILIAAIFTTLLFGEWYELVIRHKTEGYPLGKEGPVPYYYKTLEAYSTHNLNWAIIFAIILTFSVFALLRKNQRLKYYSFGIIVITIIALFLNGQITP
jgi:magnesium-transporting ATPase (P-type)